MTSASFGQSLQVVSQVTEKISRDLPTSTVMTWLLSEFSASQPEIKLHGNEGHLVPFLSQNIPRYQVKVHYTNIINLIK